MIKKVSMLSHESAQVAIGVMNPKTQSVLLLSLQIMKCGTDKTIASSKPKPILAQAFSNSESQLGS